MMKSRLALGASILLNLVAIGALAYFLTAKPATPAISTLPAITRVVTNTVLDSAPEAEPVPGPMAITRFDWRQVETADYRQYIANLRGIGCPEQTIRDIVIADVCKLYTEKRLGLLGPPRIFRYWQSSETQYAHDNVKYQESVAALEKEKVELVKELLGADLRTELAKYTGAEPRFDRSVAFLPPERRAAFQELLDKFRTLERALYADAEGGKLNDEQKQKLADLQNQREQAIASMLSPDEQREYTMSNDRLARTIRGNLNGFEASEAEFLAIYEARKALEENFPADQRKNETPEQRSVRQAAEQQADAALQAALGAERLAEYKTTQSAGYDDLYRTAKRYDLPTEAITAVVDMRKFAENSYQAILKDGGLSPEQKAVALQQLGQSTQQAAAATLGKNAYKYYVGRDGKWITRLTAPLKPAKLTNAQ